MTVWNKTIAISVVALMAGTSAFAAGKMKDRFKDVDANNNGVITYAEMMARVETEFSKFDKNGNGFLTLAELPKEMPIPERAKERMDERAERMKDRMEELADRRGQEFDRIAFEERMEKRKPTRIQFVAKLDRDGDESVSLEEFGHRAIGNFKRMDLNGNGEVTQDEANEARKMKHGKKRSGRDHSPKRW